MVAPCAQTPAAISEQTMIDLAIFPAVPKSGAWIGDVVAPTTAPGEGDDVQTSTNVTAIRMQQ